MVSKIISQPVYAGTIASFLLPREESAFITSCNGVYRASRDPLYAFVASTCIEAPLSIERINACAATKLSKQQLEQITREVSRHICQNLNSAPVPIPSASSCSWWYRNCICCLGGAEPIQDESPLLGEAEPVQVESSLNFDPKILNRIVCLDLSQVRNPVLMEQFKDLLHLFPTLKAIKLSKVFLNKRFFQAIADKGIENLDLSACGYVRDVSRIDVSPFCHNFTHLTLPRLLLCDSKAGKLVRAIAQKGLRLVHLDVSDLLFKSQESIIDIATNCEKLESLHLRGCLKYGAEEYAQALAKRGAKLTSLNLSSCLWKTGLKTITAASPHLSHLDISYSEYFSENEMLAVAIDCPRLTYLNITRCSNLTNRVMEVMAKSLTELSHLVMHQCRVEKAGRTILAQSFPKLTHIDLSQWDNLTDEDVSLFAECHPDLLEINLDGCRTLTDVAVKALANRCHTLRHLNLCSLNLTDPALLAVSKHCSQISYLDVGGCYDLTDNSLVNIAKNCRQMTHLGIGACRTLTDKTLLALAEHSYKLIRLNLVGQRAFKDEGVCAIIRRCSWLKELNISGGSITNASIKYMAKHAHSLLHLDIFACGNTTQKAVDSLKRARPYLAVRYRLGDDWVFSIRS